MRSWWSTRGRKTARERLPQEFGARVFDFVWVDDFAAARNAALARATGDYAFWLDADDVVDPPQREACSSPGGPSTQRSSRVCGAVRVRSGAEWGWRADGGGSYPALSAARGLALDQLTSMHSKCGSEFIPMPDSWAMPGEMRRDRLDT